MVAALPLSEFVLIFGQLAVFIFVVCSMLSMGLTLTLPRILQPLKNMHLVALALCANFVLIPLVAGLFVRWRYEEITASVAPLMSGASSLTLVVLTVAFFVGYLPDLAGVLGSTAIIASVLFLLAAFAIGYLLGGRDRATKRVMGLGTAQRNLVRRPRSPASTSPTPTCSSWCSWWPWSGSCS